MVFVAAELESILVGAKEAWGREDWAIESLEWLRWAQPEVWDYLPDLATLEALSLCCIPPVLAFLDSICTKYEVNFQC